jgi:hypothetical protein
VKLASSILSRLALAAPLAALAALGGLLAWRLWGAAASIVARHPNFTTAFAGEGIDTVFKIVAAIIGAAAAVACLGAAASFLRGRLPLRLVRLGFIAAYVAVAAYIVAVVRGVGVIGQYQLKIDELPQDSVTLFKLGWSLWGPALLPLAMAMIGHVMSWRGATIALFTGPAPAGAEQPPAAAEAIGDRIVENIRVGGDDPRFRRSWLTSFGGHVLLIVIIPWLITYIGCRERYNVPQGSGEAAVAAVVQVAKPVKKKKRTYILNLNSAIILTKPDLDKDSDVEENVEKASEVTYVADTNSAQARAAGKLGKGGGKKGGWPDGVGNDPVRFIRIKHGGPAWDDGMDEVSRADVNFLEEFRKITGFKVARSPEARTIAQLRNFDKGFEPPFLYLTGAGGIPVSANDVKTLRDYLLGGGMLFADAGSPAFHGSFRALMSAVFPDRQLVVIADDDPIFQAPFVFPNGAPPLWHHGGNRALGIKHQNRWAVFYHPGDINDAWKTGYSGMSRNLAEQSYNLGVNIIYHAFTNYLDQTRKYRK